MDNPTEGRRRLTGLPSSLAWTVVFGLTALLGRVIVLEGSMTNLVAPAAGVGALWLLLYRGRPDRRRQAASLFAVAAVVIACTGTPVPVAVLLAGVNLGQALLFALLFHRWTPIGERVDGPLLVDLRSLGTLLAAAGTAALAGASSGTAMVFAHSGMWSVWETAVWQGRNMVAIVIIVPIGLRVRQVVLSRRGRLAGAGVLPLLQMSGWRWVELGLAVLATELGNLTVFQWLPHYPVTFLLFVVTAWVALRFDSSWTALRNGATVVFAVLSTMGGDGPFAAIPDLGARALVVQVYAGTGAVLGLALALGRDERLVLLRRVRSAATEATDHARHVQVLADASRAVLLADDARAAVCEAVRDLTGADGVCLLEPDGAGQLVSTARAGLDLPPVCIDADPRSSLTAWAFSAGEAVFVPDVRTEPRVSVNLIERLGVISAAWHPAVLADDRVVATISLVWRHQVTELPVSTVRVLDVLAREAARAIERGDLVEQLAQAADHDQLTGLANRRRWDELSAAEVARAERTRSPLSLLLVDLDHFKAYNDTRGHQAGDVLLREFATAATACLRDGDLMARWGGEEFVLALPGCTDQEARAVADRIRVTVPRGQTATVGVAQWVPGEAPGDTLARADAAMYDGKRSGRARTVVAAQPVVVPG